jgi:hypothetical protein
MAVMNEFERPPMNRREAIQGIAATGAVFSASGLSPIPQHVWRAIMASLQPAAAAAVPDAATATPKVARKRFENDRVRVYDHISDPGDKEAWHAHLAMVVYVVTGGTLRVTTADGKANDVEFKAGEVIWREPVAHCTENIGKTRLHAVLVELKTA